MAVSTKIRKLLDKHGVPYKHLQHKTVFTAHDMAHTLKAQMEDVLKTVLVRADKVHVLVVVPASHLLDFKKLAKVLKVKKIEIAGESTMKKLFNVEPGNISPFSAVHDVPLYADKVLVKAKQVIGRAGSYQDSVAMKAKDWLAVAGATVVDVGQKMKKVAKKSSGKKSSRGKNKKPVTKAKSKKSKSRK